MGDGQRAGDGRGAADVRVGAEATDRDQGHYLGRPGGHERGSRQFERQSVGDDQRTRDQQADPNFAAPGQDGGGESGEEQAAECYSGRVGEGERPGPSGAVQRPVGQRVFVRAEVDEGAGSQQHRRQAQVVVAPETPDGGERHSFGRPGGHKSGAGDFEGQRVGHEQRAGDQQCNSDVGPPAQPPSRESGEQQTGEGQPGRVGEGERTGAGGSLKCPVKPGELVLANVGDGQRSEDGGRSAGIVVFAEAEDRRQYSPFDRPAHRHRRTVELALDSEGYGRDTYGVDQQAERVFVATAPHEVSAEGEVRHGRSGHVGPLPRGEIAGQNP